jgi:hypothetical protein
MAKMSFAPPWPADRENRPNVVRRVQSVDIIGQIAVQLPAWHVDAARVQLALEANSSMGEKPNEAQTPPPFFLGVTPLTARADRDVSASIRTT